ncbi:AAA family ATPase [Acetobacterium wieringae]|uniref:phage NrS-1 polymerase family protein n=1 Tax=Acetobacterium wieringae TaxID=52694 RepID=UPI002B1F64C6|nr:AAA family ATPase [Acetobacterium wieringae]MEA4804791.1 AAA family ATPase [Acetobacterium wieringae]
MTEQFENIPKDLKKLPQWVGYTENKVPINPGTLYGAKANAPDTWSTYDDAVMSIGLIGTYTKDKKPVKEMIVGVGFEFNHNDIVGIDLDHVIDADGNLHEKAESIYQRLNSYTEISPSGTGLHIFVYGDIPVKGKNKRNGLEEGKGIEMYKAEHYLTMTGHVFGDLKPIERRELEIKALFEEYFPQVEKDQVAIDFTVPAIAPVDVDYNLLNKIRASKQGDKFRKLFDHGDISGYPSQSEADMALCNILAWWCNKDAGLMDHFFRMSGLMRSKWDRPESTHGTHGNRTIQEAISKCTGGYDLETYKHDNYSVTITESGTEVVTVQGQQKALPAPKSLDMVNMANAEEKAPDWLIKGYIPKYQITTMAGDGGSGKTTVWCALAAAVSSGKKPFLLAGDPLLGAFIGEPQKVFFFSAEDSYEHVLKRRLRKNDANLENIFSIDIADDRFKDIKFNSPFLEALIIEHRPALVIFDPIQAFIPPELRMAERNAMRSCLAPLVGYGEKYGATFIIVVHANKQSGVWGRKRMADSADIWDISRSVIMAGETDEKPVRYLSHEKSNYSMTSNTVLYTIDDEVVKFESYTDRKDREFVSADTQTRAAPDRDNAKEFIEDFLKDGEKEVKELDSLAAAMSISKKTMERAKADLKKSGFIKYRSESLGKGKGLKHFISLDGFAALVNDHE